MLIKISVPAESNIKLETPMLELSYKDATYKLKSGKDGLVNFVSITKKVDATDKKFIEQSSEVKKALDKNPKTFPIHPIDKEMMDKLKYLENILYDECDLKLEWSKLHCEYCCENNEEKILEEKGEICRSWGRVVHVKSPRLLEDPKAIICRLEYCEGIELELDFFRHANSAIKDENYIEAFFNLYLILESYYAKGTFRNQEKVFKKDSVLRKIINELIEDKNTKSMYSKILTVGEPTVDGIIDELVETRGKIFHFSNINNPKRHITYQNQEAYRDHVFALRGIVWRGMMKRHVELQQKVTKSSLDEV